MLVGVDVLILLTLGMLCAGVVTLFCWNRIPTEEAEAAIMASLFTVTIMVIGYVIMARVLDGMLGPYTW